MPYIKKPSWVKDSREDNVLQLLWRVLPTLSRWGNIVRAITAYKILIQCVLVINKYVKDWMHFFFKY